MTAYPRHAFDVAPGDPQPTVFTPLAQFFRRIVAAVRRKPAPEGVASGAAPTALLTPPDGTPVLGDRMLSDVRREHGAPPALRFRPSSRMSDAEIADLDARLDAALRRPVNGIYLGTLPRRQPGATLPYVEPLVDRGPRKPPWRTQEMPALYRNGWQ